MAGQACRQAMQCSQRWANTGRPSAAMFPAGQTFAQTPQPVQASDTVNFLSQPGRRPGKVRYTARLTGP